MADYLGSGLGIALGDGWSDYIILHLPLNNSIDVPQPLTLTWNSPVGAGKYHIQIATDITFLTLVVDDETLLTNQYTISNLPLGVTYYWRVRFC